MLRNGKKGTYINLVSSLYISKGQTASRSTGCTPCGNAHVECGVPKSHVTSGVEHVGYKVCIDSIERLPAKS